MGPLYGVRWWVTAGTSSHHGPIFGNVSRLCVNPDYDKKRKKLSAHDACKAACKNNKCGQKPAEPSEAVVSIEDLVTEGSESKTCPYAGAEALARKADVLFVPYAMVLDGSVSAIAKVKNSVVVFDEAHNVPSSARDAREITVELPVIAKFKTKVRVPAYRLQQQSRVCVPLEHLMGFFSQVQSEQTGAQCPPEALDDLKALETILDKFMTRVMQCASKGLVVGCPHSFKPLDDFLSVEDLSIACTHIETWKSVLLYRLNQASKHQYQNVMSFMSKLLERSAAASSNYVVAVECRKSATKKRKRRLHLPQNSKISCWLLEPKIVMETLTRTARTVVHMSGSIEDADWFASRVAIGSNAIVENTADVVDRGDNLTVFVVNDDRVSGQFRHRTTEDGTLEDNYAINLRTYQLRMPSSAVIVVDIVRALLDYAISCHVSHLAAGEGAIVFFTSRDLLTQCVEHWKSGRLYAQMHKTAQIFQSRDTVKFEKHVKANKRRAVLFAVCRDSVSEGLDLDERCARLIIVVSIPYAGLFSPNVEAMRAFEDKKVSPLFCSIAACREGVSLTWTCACRKQDKDRSGTTRTQDKLFGR